MAQNSTQPSFNEDEMDLREIVKILLESKKLIISTILIFTTASIIYSLSLKPSFLTSTILEIGYYEMPDGNQQLIEKPSNLISDLKVLIMKNSDNKFNQNVSMNSFEGKLINLETTSSSVEQNENILNEIINYIDERHSNLAVLITDQKKLTITSILENVKSELSFTKAKQLNENQAKKLTITRILENVKSELSFTKAKQLNENQAKKLTINSILENVKSELSFTKAKQLNENQLKRSKIEDRIAKLKTELPIIDLEISQLEKVIIDDTNNLSLLKRNEEIRTERASNSPTLEQIIFSYNSEINDLKAKKYTNILETKSLNNQLKKLENVTLQSDELFRLEQEQQTLENQLISLENVTLQSDELFRLEQEQQTLENQLISLENVTFQSDELFRLEQEQQTLENQLELLMTQTQIKTRPISNIETKTIKPKTQLSILLGLIIGLITSIFLVFIRTFVKSYKES
jgi:capsular polysaccharide biosynthesis protein